VDLGASELLGAGPAGGPGAVGSLRLTGCLFTVCRFWVFCGIRDGTQGLALPLSHPPSPVLWHFKVQTPVLPLSVHHPSFHEHLNTHLFSAYCVPCVSGTYTGVCELPCGQSTTYWGLMTTENGLFAFGGGSLKFRVAEPCSPCYCYGRVFPVLPRPASGDTGVPWLVTHFCLCLHMVVSSVSISL
jgi:hypothetical protein